MKITFILPCAGLTGGVRIIRNYASGLLQRGHQVTLVVPLYNLQPTPLDQEKPILSSAGIGLLRATLHRWLKEDHLDHFEGRLLTPLTLHEDGIPDADIIVASAWQTAEWVGLYSAAKGKKFYFIQHYEVWSGPKERVDATWKLPMTKIVIAKWLKQIGEEQLGVSVEGPLYNPVDHRLFYPVARKSNAQLRIGMLHSHAPWKGFADGLQAIERAKQEVPNIQLVILSSERPSPHVPKDAEFHRQPRQKRLREIYSSCDVWLCSSWSEGYHLPPFEAMACGCALVSTRVGGVEDMCVHEESALISEPRSPEALAANLSRVLKNPELRTTLARNGHQVTSQLKWDDNMGTLESLFKRHLNSGSR